MALKGEVRALLASSNEPALAAAVAGDVRVGRLLVARLWDIDRSVAERASRGLGEYAARWPEATREIVRRLLWALNDESGTNGAPALAALGEIGRRAPDLIASYVPALVETVHDAGLHLELLQALTAIAATAPGLVAPHLPALERAFDRSPPRESTAFQRLLPLLSPVPSSRRPQSSPGDPEQESQGPMDGSDLDRQSCD